MQMITDVETLEQHYGTPAKASTVKVATQLTAEYAHWIGASRFCALGTIGPEGTDVSPRGDDGPVVQISDPKTLMMPDWHGNNRLDSLRNIVRDPRMSLMFFVPGSNNVVRVNGRAHLTADDALRASFARDGKSPRTVIVIEVAEIYFQCARALVRSGLWRAEDESAGLPTAGGFLAAMTKGEIDGTSYDAGWSERASKTLW